MTTAEAAATRRQSGPNEVPDARESFARRLVDKLWAPVPWMLEAAMVLELWQGKLLETGVIAALVLFNAVMAMFQEGRAQSALAALKTRLALNAHVHRDGVWQTIAARDVVPGDAVKLSLGAVVPADACIVLGNVLLDQSILTGESAPVEASEGDTAFSGAMVRRGEATAVVTATGPHTKFGRTAELVKTAHVVGTQQKSVLRVVRNLAFFNGLVVIAFAGYAWRSGAPWVVIEPIVLVCVLASIPVSLPATFTMAAALAAHALTGRGVLPTRLSALDEAGTMDVLCSDKTGTLTRNELRVALARPAPGYDEARLLGLAALASSDGGADPVDAAIRATTPRVGGLPTLIAFQPFDPATKRAEARVVGADGREWRIVKGAFAAIADAAQADTESRREAEKMEAQGYRVLAVAIDNSDGLTIAGLIAMSDPPRDDAAALVARLHEHAVRVVMVTGDAPVTAQAVAREIGIAGPVCVAGVAAQNLSDYAVFAGVLPEDKFSLVRALQAEGHVVGMCGDGVNDAPALRQAHMGIAVSQATDVAKAAAGLVLTEPGLGSVLAAIEEGRKAFRRVHTYALNSIVKKIVTVLFITIGFVMTGHPILTPLLMIVLLVAGDFLSMSIATDRAVPSLTPNVWRVDALTAKGVVLGLAQLAFATAVLAIGAFGLHFGPDTLMTLAFLTLVFGGQATIYAIRTQGKLWETAPSGWLVAASVADITIGVIVATTGYIATPLPVLAIAVLLVASAWLAYILNGLSRLTYAPASLRR
ncbi:HAD-IC family P-type ATPase (plasmid) [Nitrobacter sp. NHB1]|uniref:HAD-IC family P-type ATPase n=1 Tax=Nitrobacter sp. NHB1 TaxID=3119830 RepID=UPI002FFE4B1E